MEQKKYKTVIELITEAENPSEALDIAGEYLRGNIETGVSMKCYSKPLQRETIFGPRRSYFNVNQ